MSLPLQTTGTVTSGWAPDVVSRIDVRDFFADREPLIMRGATVVNASVEGDRPSVLVPWIDSDANVPFIPEGTEIPPEEPAFAQTEIRTGKLSKLLILSNELVGQESVSEQYLRAASRALALASNRAFLLNEPDNNHPNFSVGLLHDENVLQITEPFMGANFDLLQTAIGLSESEGGMPDLLVMNPYTWSVLQQLKTGEGSNQPLLGLGTEATERRLAGLEVRTEPSMPDGKLLVIDPTSTAAVIGPVVGASDTSRYFEKDSRAIRTTWRQGWKVMHPTRNILLTVDPTIMGGADPSNKED